MQVVATPLTQALGAGAPISRRELKALMRRTNRPGLMRLGLWVATLCFTAGLIWAAGSNPWLLVPAMFLHGVVVVHHFALQHECTHYTAFRSRRLCDALAHVCGLILLVPPTFFRYEHCDHHTHTNLHGRDPEMIELPLSPWRYLCYLSAVPYWRGQIWGLCRRAAGRLTAEETRFVPVVARRRVIGEARAILAIHLGLGVAMLATGWTAPLTYWLLPLLLGEPVMRFIRMSEHVGRPQVADMRRNTRTTVVSAPLRFLAWNMNFHAEHHFASSVPFHALGALHEKLRGHVTVEPHGYLGAHLEILRAMRRKAA